MGCVAFGACSIDSSTTRTEKGGGQIRQSILGYQREGGRIVGLKQFGVRAVLLPVQSGMKGETVKWVVDHGGKGGQVIRDSRGDGSGGVAEEQDDLQEGFFFSRQGTF